MPWWGWLAAGLIATGLWRLSFRALVNILTPPIDGDDFAGCLLMATIGFLGIGPGVLVVGLIKRAAGTRDWGELAVLIAGETREQKLARREREVREREDYIRRMERELKLT